jgi:glycosyltransferase involved in cell wall biosynthesis
VSSAETGSGKALVSVCIPSYNASRYIGATIKSVLDSTHSNLEVIVNDDASTDNTREIVASFGDERIRFFQNESNLGVPRNWNRALKRAAGEFVGLLNHDDLYGPFWLTFAAHVLEKHPHVGWVVTKFRIINDKGETLGVESRFPATGEYGQREAFLCVAKLDGLGPGYIARREILEEAGYYDEDAGPSADNDLFLRLASRYPLYYSNNPHTAWRWHADNLTHRWGIVQQTADSLRTLNKIFSDDGLPEELRKLKKTCYAYYYHKVLAWARKLLNEGELETVQQLIHLLHTDGYREIDAG